MSKKKKYPWNKLPSGKKEKKEDDPAEFESVYAGPDFFGEDGGETADPAGKERETSAGTAENAGDPPSPLPSVEPDPRMFLCVYAGPEYFESRASGAGGGAPTVSVKPGKSAYYCPNCGFPVPADAKYCPECGAAQPVKKNNE